MSYGQPGQFQNYQNQYVQSPASAAQLMQRVSYMLCTALLVTAACAYFSPALPPGAWIGCMIGTFVCIFAINLAKTNTALSGFLLYVLSALEGFMIGPMISAICRGYPWGSLIVGEAAGLTGIIVAGVGSYVWITNKDFGYLGKMLFYALVGIIVVSIISLFWHTLAAMSGFQLGISMLIVMVFVGFTLYDFSNIKHRYGPNDFVIATVALYLDFLNLFLAILRILMIVGGGGSSRKS